MDDRTFWLHPDAIVEAIAAHDRYAEVTIELAERFQEELERARHGAFQLIEGVRELKCH